jgi:hypothetical protein
LTSELVAEGLKLPNSGKFFRFDLHRWCRGGW